MSSSEGSTCSSDTSDSSSNDALHPNPPATLLEAFANTAKRLQQFGVERIRVVGLSAGCDAKPNATSTDVADENGDGVRVVTEQEFMREYVFLSRPCIILDAVEDWPALRKWRDDRYIFDLDHHLPLEEEKSESEEEEEEEEEKGKEGSSGSGSSSPAANANETAEAVPAKEAGRLGPKKVTVALTPNGRADAVTYVVYDKNDIPAEATECMFGKQAAKQAVPLTSHPAVDAANSGGDAAAAAAHIVKEKVFLYAAEVRVTLPELYQLLQQSPSVPPSQPTHIDMRAYKDGNATPVVAYAQLQNNCLNTEYTHLHADLRTNVQEFGTRVFGGAPEAANVWFGVPASVSSMHQDWVENLYPVMRGVKEFILIPPWEGVFVPKPDLPSAGFVLDEARSDQQALRFAFKPYPQKDGTVVPWMDFDFTPDLLEEGGDAAVLAALNERIDDNAARKPPIDPKLAPASASKESRKLKELHPLVAYVHPGETLYLPAMWLHRVAQHADELDIRTRAQRHLRSQASKEGEPSSSPPPPLPLIAAVNYWYDMSFLNPSVVMLREFGLLL